MITTKNFILNISKGVLCTSLLLGAVACDPLGIEPTTTVDQDRFWLNSQLARSYVNNFYFISESASGDKFQSEQWSDNCQGNYEQDWDTYRQTRFTKREYDENSGIGVFNAPWSSAYKNIRAVNLGIDKISTSTNLTEDLKNQLLAECYFFRAYVYFDMEKYWGAVPYIDKALSVSDNTYVPQTNREVLFDKILEDLKTSADYFSKTTIKPELGMVNVDVVNSFKSRVSLYAANAADASAKGIYKDDAKGLFKFEKNSEYYYNISYAAAKEVVGKYSLVDDYADLFTASNAHESKESIWPVMFKKSDREGFNPTAINGPDGYYYGGNKDKSHQWGYRSGLFPTQDLVDCYLQKDSKDGKWKKWWETSQAKELGIAVNAKGEIKGSGKDYRKIYENRDERFYSTITYDGSYMGPEQEMYMIQTWIDNTTEGEKKYSSLHTGYRFVETLESAPINRASTQTITGYYSRKYSHFDSFYDDGTLNKEQKQTCFFNIRYAEVLLNCAEASYKLGKADAKGFVDQIRERAGLSKYNESEAGHDLWDEIKLQRRIEFAFECPGFRYFDLLRWAEADGKTTIEELNTPSRGIWIFRKGKESEEIGEQGYPVKEGEKGYFTPKFETFKMSYNYYERKFDDVRYYFVPFSLTTLKDYKEIQQSPGWKDFRYNN